MRMKKRERPLLTLEELFEKNGIAYGDDIEECSIDDINDELDILLFGNHCFIKNLNKSL